MKKIIYTKYGNHEVLQMADVEVPAVSDETLLIKVKAVSINPLDWRIFSGQMKLMTGSRFPKGVGIDFSGVVEEIGNKITSFKKGDEVFGLLDVFKGGALTEYVLVNQNQLTLKPRSISFEQASALSVTGSSALQILEGLTPLREEPEVLINGATGGIGMFVTQLARKKGVKITATTNSRGVPFAKKWGATQVLNYREQNILDLNKKFDLIIDLTGKLTFTQAKTLMKVNATYVCTLPGPKQIITSFLNNLFFRKKYKILFLKPKPVDLIQLANLASNGLCIVVDKTYSIDAFSEAYESTPKGGVLGKVVFKI